MMQREDEQESENCEVEQSKLSELHVKFFDSTKEHNIAQCKHCKAKVKFSTKASSNLITHLKRCCPKHHAKYMDLKLKATKSRQHSKSDSNRPNDQTTMSAFLVKKKTQEKFSRNDVRQKTITKALINSIACDQLPLNILESPTFRKLLETTESRYSIPSRPTVRNTMLPKVMKQMENVIKEELSTLDHIYITLDLWTNRNMASFLGMTVHFVDEKWTLKSFVLAVDSFAGRHTADNIATTYHSIASKYDIWNRVNKIVSDNASSMIKAFSISLPNFVLERDEQHGNQTEHHEVRTNEDDMELEEESDVDDVDNLLADLPQRISCFAHTKQLCIRDGLHQPSFLKSFVGKLLAKISKIVNSVRKSTIASPFLRQKGLVLRAQNATRWNSQLTMIESVLKNHSYVNDALDLMVSTEKILDHDVLALNELVTVLKPFQEALLVVEGDKRVTASSICSIVVGLQKKFNAFSNQSFRYCNGLITSLQQSIHKRLKSFLDCRDNQIAALLDPRFKTAWIQEDELKQSVIARLTTLVCIKRSAVAVLRAEDEVTSEPLVKRPSLFGFIDTSKSTSISDPHFKQVEVTEYLQEQIISFDENPLSFWKNNEKKFPHLSQLAREYLGCAATSAPSERVFSIAGNFYTSDRSLLGTATFRSLMFIKCNQSLYDKINF